MLSNLPNQNLDKPLSNDLNLVLTIKRIKCGNLWVMSHPAKLNFIGNILVLILCDLLNTYIYSVTNYQSFLRYKYRPTKICLYNEEGSVNSASPPISFHYYGRFVTIIKLRTSGQPARKDTTLKIFQYAFSGVWTFFCLFFTTLALFCAHFKFR